MRIGLDQRKEAVHAAIVCVAGVPEPGADEDAEPQESPLMLVPVMAQSFVCIAVRIEDAAACMECGVASMQIVDCRV